jgi:pimeloyl-ACP methyl ester carboxylesterase
MASTISFCRATTTVGGLLLLILASCTTPVATRPNLSTMTAADDTNLANDQICAIPMTDASGQNLSVRARVCRRKTGFPARLVVINHGAPTAAAARPGMELGRCGSEAAQWFLSRGYVVVFVLRRGYGASGGEWAERYGTWSNPDLMHAGIQPARDINAVVEDATALSFVRRDGAVVVGQSGRRWGTRQL